MDYDGEIADARNKRKHVTLTIQEKLEIIELVESGKLSRQTIANMYNIGKSTVHDIHKRKDTIKNFAQQNSTDLTKRRRVDIKLDAKADDSYTVYKEDESNGIVEEETLVENFGHGGFDYNEQGYEIVYEPILCNSNEIISSNKPLIEIHEKSNIEENGTKRKSKTLTLKEKYDILVQLDEGKSVSSIVNKYGIGRTTLYDLKKQKQKIFEFIENSSGETRRTFKKSNYPAIENNLLDWCNSRDCYTEQEFFDEYKLLFSQQKAKNSSPFSGSWSWCKRFFQRNPEHKKKLIESKSSISEDTRASDGLKLFNESGSIIVDDSSSPNRRVANYLSINEKVQVIDEASNGKAVPVLADKWNISKSTVYEILKKEDEIRQHSNDNVNLDRKVIKSSRYSDIEKELYDWCMQQQPFPTYITIADKAYSIFISLDIKGNFNPSSKWAKEFVERHPELSNRCYNGRAESISESSDGVAEDSTIENMHDESLEFIEQDFIKVTPKIEKIEHDDYGNEYIIEELDEDGNSEDSGTANYEEQRESVSKKKEDSYIVADEDAMNSLKVLIKYSEQRGHDEISALLVEYRNILEEENLL